jgi:CBS domain-containing protein
VCARPSADLICEQCRARIRGEALERTQREERGASERYVGVCDTRDPMLAPSLFRGRVQELIRRPPVTCPPGAPLTDVARQMSVERVGSVVVLGADGTPLGIVTDRDLRRKVVEIARDPKAASAAEVMSTPLVTIAPAAFAFEALLEMTRREIHHLAVVNADRLVGVVSTNDFIVLQAEHPVVLAREISRATSVESLREIGSRTVGLVRRLVNDGGSAYDVGRLVAELNDRLVTATLGLTTAALRAHGTPPPETGYCWLALGSEARREQTLRTDQDNGLVYEDPPSGRRESLQAYYRHFSAAVVDNLVTIGFPRCPGDVMASNPRWCQPLSVWAGYFRTWMSEPEPEPLLAAQTHFDLRPLGATQALGQALRDLIVEEAPRHRSFLRLLARDVVDRRPPLTVFGNVAIERRGARRGTVDVKAAALPLVGAARLHALELGLAETNTVDRLYGAGARGLYTEAETREISDAFKHVTRLRLVHQLEQLERGDVPDNAVRVNRLSRGDGLLFRDALRTVQRVQAGVRERFQTDLMR